jgi:uncharacterized protein (TIGR03083 family)
VNWPEILDREGHLLLDVARTDPAADVPSCPDFDMAKLVRHVDFVYRRVGVAVAGTTDTPFRRDEALPAPVPVDQALAAFPADLSALVAALRSADPDRPTWTMTAPEGHVAFWLRRAGHETTVHRVDAQQAAGIPVDPVGAEQALDGVAELLELASARWAGEVAQPVTVHLHATDAEGEWLVRFGPDGMVVEAGHATGDAAVRGPVSDLYLWLWGRLPATTLEVFGDTDAVDRLRDAASI